MRLYAHTFAEVWRQWDNVAAWRLDGPRLFIAFRGPTRGSGHAETVDLPAEVIGLRDDSPVRVASASESTAPRAGHERGREAHLHVSAGPPVLERLRIPGGQPPRSRFGDSPRRRQFKGDGS